MNLELTGTGLLLRHHLRRDRWMLLAWAVAATLLYYSQAVSVAGLYPTQADFDEAAATMQHNTAFVAMAGPARALNTIGGQVTWQAAAFGCILAGLMSMFLVGRHTRVDEEKGRDELVRAGVVGRHAPMTAALLVAMTANLLLGLGVSASLLSWPLAAADSIALGVGLTLCGWLFSGTALVAMQLTASARSAYGIAGLAIGVAYVLRAIGDVGNGALSWLSPIGWYQGMHAFSGLRWWPVLLLVAGAALSTTTSYLVFDRRDLGAGVLASRPGPSRGTLRGPLGLAWRLQRGAVVGWSAGLFLTGLAYGSMGNDVGSLIGDSTSTRELFVRGGGSLVDGFYATAVSMIALIGVGFAVSSALRARGEEIDGRVESLLATGLARSRWLLSHVAVTVAGTVVALALGGLGLGLGFAMVTGDASRVGPWLLASLTYVAPVLVLAAVARLLYGLVPRLASLAWLALAFCVVVLLFAEGFRFPPWVRDLSPFTHLAMMPAQDFRWWPFVALLIVAVLFSAAGQLAFRRRDLH
jgi:ABC-2 type transport system permease protein